MAVNTLNGNNLPPVGAPATGAIDRAPKSEVQVNPFQSIPFITVSSTIPNQIYSRFDWT